MYDAPISMIIANNFNNVRHFVSILFFAKIGVVTLFFPAPLSFGHGCERLLTCWTWMWQSRSARSLPRSFRAAQFYQERGGCVEPLEIPTKMKTRFAGSTDNNLQGVCNQATST